MKIGWQRFNIYLALVLVAAGVCGCDTLGFTEYSGPISTLRLHLEVSRDSTKDSVAAPVYRTKPVTVRVDKVPFATERNIKEAKVVDVVGGFALRLKFNQAGTALLEQVTVANRGRRIAVWSQFGEQLKDGRWLGAPLINQRISDGVLVLTTDTTREEAEVIALGLNNVGKKTD